MIFSDFINALVLDNMVRRYQGNTIPVTSVQRYQQLEHVILHVHNKFIRRQLMYKHLM